MSKLGKIINENYSIIMAVASSIGVVTTVILAVEATPKAIVAIQTAEQEKGEKLTKYEVIKAGWKSYLPTICIGSSVIFLIMAPAIISDRKQKSLASAYALLDTGYKQYKQKVEEKLSNDEKNMIEEEIIRDNFKGPMDVNDGEMIFYEYFSRRYFKSTVSAVMAAECKFLEQFKERGYACVNEYYEYLGLEPVSYGYELGWNDCVEDCNPYNCYGLDINYQTIKLNDNRDCMVIYMTMWPQIDYIY